MVDEPQQDINDPKNNDEVEAKPKSKPKEKAAEKGKDGKRKIQGFKGFDAGKYIDVEPTLPPKIASPVVSIDPPDTLSVAALTEPSLRALFSLLALLPNVLSVTFSV